MLGGYDLAISAYSKNPEGALAFMNFATSPEPAGDPGVRGVAAAGADGGLRRPEVKKAMPFAAELCEAVEQAQPRPVSPVYPQISEAIYTNVYAALQGDTRPTRRPRDERGHPEGDRDVLARWKPQPLG